MESTGRAVFRLPKDNCELDFAFFGLVERDHAFHLASVIEHANFAASEFCARSGVADCVLFCVFAGPVGLNAPPFKTLPAASEWRNLDNRCTRLHGIS